LKTRSKASALRASRSIASKLDDFWMQLRLSEIDVPASHLLVKGKPKEAFLSHAPKLSESLAKYAVHTNWSWPDGVPSAESMQKRHREVK
jgi:hypothetical protein